MRNKDKMAGLLIVAAVLGAVAWRVVVAPAVLGDFDSADMPHRDRAFLSIGNVFVAVLFAASLGLIAAPAGSRFGPLARASRYLGIAALGLAAIGTAGLVFWQGAIYVLSGYMVCIGLAWALTGWSLFRTRTGATAIAALATGALYAAGTIVALTGVHIIFVMTVAALPLAVALIASSIRAGERESRVRVSAG